MPDNSDKPKILRTVPVKTYSGKAIVYAEEGRKVIDWKEFEYAAAHGYRIKEVTQKVEIVEDIEVGERERVVETSIRMSAPNKRGTLNKLIKNGLLSRERRGNYAVVSTLFKSSLIPNLKGQELYFTRREDAIAYAETFRKASKKVEGSSKQIVPTEEGKWKVGMCRGLMFPIIVESDRITEGSLFPKIESKNDLVGILHFT